MRREKSSQVRSNQTYRDPEEYFARVQMRKKLQEEEEFRRQRNAKARRRELERQLAQQKELERQQKKLRGGASGRPQSSQRQYFEEERAYRRQMQQQMAGQMQQKKKKKKGKVKRFFLGIFIFLILLILAAGVIWFTPSLKKPAISGILKSPFGPALVRLFIGGNYDAHVRDKDFKDKDIILNEGAYTPKGNITFAMIGVDARDEELTIGTRADSMIVVNVTPDGNIRMASVYRDAYLLSHKQDGQEVISKANAAYYWGGPLGTVNMLNENFDLAITDYIVVNFSGLTNIIDLLGGLRLNVTEIERDTLNYHMYEQNMYAGTEYIPLEEYGENILLTGSQATAFCRLRSCKFDSPVDGQTYRDDYARTARQRYALMELVKQAKEQGIVNLLQLMNDLFAANDGNDKFIQTSFSIKELTAIMAQGMDMNIESNAAFPDADHQYTTMLDSGDSMVADTLEENVVLIHQFLYDTENYIPTADLVRTAEKIRTEIRRQGK
ncbi:MAG: LCP family protein [Lachnospiraceae bacterium]|nr:LCP family protein [Lachnospiraceae bacterium]